MMEILLKERTLKTFPYGMESHFYHNIGDFL